MKIAIMQPYFFPYIGYFQLIKDVDLFVFYDDVNFIKGGWINRNRLIQKNVSFMFTVPLTNISSNKKINEIKISSNEFNKWKKKFFKTIEQNYYKAPFFNETVDIINITLNSEFKTISDLAIVSIVNTCNYLGIKTNFEISSQKHSESKLLKREERLVAICKKNECKTYINPIGGRELYTKEYFIKKGIELLFLKSNDISYNQFSNIYVPNLSIIDVLMFNSNERIKELLNEYKLI